MKIMHNAYSSHNCCYTLITRPNKLLTWIHIQHQQQQQNKNNMQYTDIFSTTTETTSTAKKVLMNAFIAI